MTRPLADPDRTANLDGYLDGELSPEERSSFERDLEASADLRRALEERRELDRELRALPAMDPSPQFEARFWARVARSEETRGLLGRLRGWGWAIAGPVVATAAFLLLFGSPSLPESDLELVSDAEGFELVMAEDPELLGALDVLEVLDDWEVL